MTLLLCPGRILHLLVLPALVVICRIAIYQYTNIPIIELSSDVDVSDVCILLMFFMMDCGVCYPPGHRRNVQSFRGSSKSLPKIQRMGSNLKIYFLRVLFWLCESEIGNSGCSDLR